MIMSRSEIMQMSNRARPASRAWEARRAAGIKPANIMPGLDRWRTAVKDRMRNNARRFLARHRSLKMGGAAPSVAPSPVTPITPALSGLGFSLKPPAWLRNIAGAVMKGTTISIPTPAGTIQVDGSDPQAYQKVLDMLKGTKVSATVGEKPATFPDRANQAIESIPGGWVTVAALGVAAVMLLKGRR